LERIPEEYIHYIWQYGLFDQQELRTTEDIPIRILNKGFHNHHAGPDFSNVRIGIGADEWAGHVEIHFKSSDWNNHNHQLDPAYDNVILHVVFLHDKEILTSKGASIPTLSLSTRFDISHFRKYEDFMKNKAWVPCEKSIGDVPEIKLISLKERMCSERLEDKSELFLAEVERQIGDLESALFTLVSQALGAKVNAEPFRILSYIIPLEVISKHSDSPELLEALFLGQAGFLDQGLSDHYVFKLKQDYDFLKHKYALKSMNYSAWKHAPLRPASAPAVRIVQLARIYGKTKSLSGIFLNGTIDEVQDRLDISLEGYWKEHHSLAKKSKSSVKRIGPSMRDILLINVVAVLRYAYGKMHAEQRYKDSAVSLLEGIHSEDNSIIRKWEALGIKCENAFDSQALLQLKKQHCDKSDCLRCIVGREVLK
jgi:hypothetical protein